MQYKFNTSKLVDFIVPRVLSKPVLLAYLKVLISPIQTLFALFLDYRLYSIQEKNKNGQAILLRAALGLYIVEDNEAPEHTIPVPTGILVEDYEYNVDLPITTLIEEKLIAEDMLSVGLISEDATTSLATIEETITPYDFQVKISSSLYINDNTIKTVKAVVDAYRNAGRTYTIKIID